MKLKSATTLPNAGVPLEEAILAVDWSLTELGPPTGWPQSLRSIIALMVASGTPMFVVWGTLRRLIYNAAYGALLGGRHPTALGSPFFSVWPDSLPHLGPLFERLFGGAVVDLDDISISFDRDDATPGGDFALSYTPIRDHGNQVVGVLCIHSDAAVRGQLEAPPREQSRLAQMFELAPSFIAILRGPAHVIELANAGFLRLVGDTSVVGKRIDEALPDAASKGLLAVLDRAFDTAQRAARPGMRCGMARAADGRMEEHFVDFTFQPITDATGKVTGIFVHGSDVTERRNLEEQLRQSQKMEAVGQLTGGLAHDFNNLLSGISGSLELLRIRKAEGRFDELDRYIVAAEGAVQRAAALTHRLLAFARRQTLEARPVNLRQLAAGMHELIRRTVGPSITVVIRDAGEPWTAWVDPNQLENALLNLCINARDAMPDGGDVVIETNTHRLGEGACADIGVCAGEYLSLCVSDTGDGMTPEILARAVEPFFTTKAAGEGTGLGLSMIDGFVRQSGGRLVLSSIRGEGTSVCLYLPRHVGGGHPMPIAAVVGESPVGSPGGTVLVVEDEPTVRMLVTEVLKDLGYQTITATDGIQALSVFRSAQRIDLLVTDIGLPGGLDGRQVAEAARTLREGVKVLYITGYADMPGGDAWLGDAQILVKPFSMQDLTARIADLLRP